MKLISKAALGITLGFLCFAQTGCSQRNQAQTAESADLSPTIPVSVTSLTTAESSETVQAWGTVHAWQEATIIARVGGTITHSRVSLGNTVTKDELLLEIDPELYGARVAEAEARVGQAVSSLEIAGKNLARAETLFKNDKVSDTELETSSLNEAKARAEEAAAQAALQQARLNERNARPRAPFSGLVANRVLNAGTNVNPGELLVQLVDLDRVTVVVEISEQDLSRITVGAQVGVRVEGMDNVFRGTVRGLGPKADADSRQFPAEIEVPNADHSLKAGMIAKIEIIVQSYHDVPQLPIEALVEHKGDMGFYVVKNGKAEWRLPVLGPRTETHVAVLEGAQARDSVVVLGQNRLQDGTLVQVEPAP